MNRDNKRSLIIRSGIIIFFYIVSFFPLHLIADEQTAIFEHLSIEHGLSQSTVQCILQDDKGFMWFGTSDGLNRYDGKKFSVYRHKPGDPESISNNAVVSLYKDRSGILWIGTDGGGLNRYDSKTETFKHYINNPDKPQSLCHDSVYAICEDKRGVLWVGTYGGGLSTFDISTEEFTHYKHVPDQTDSLSNDIVLSIVEDSSGVIWIGTRVGLSKYDPYNKTFSCPAVCDFFGNTTIFSIHEDQNGLLWFGTYNGLYCYDPKNRIRTSFLSNQNDDKSLSHNIVITCLSDHTGKLWVGTYDGLNKLNKSKNTFVHYKSKTSEGSGLNSNTIRSLYEDQSGVLWIGTDAGLNKLYQARCKFRHYKHRPDDPNSLSYNVVFTLLTDQSGKIWIGTNGGLDKFDKDTSVFIHYNHEPNNPYSLSHDVVYSLCQDHSGTLWIGTNQGLNRYDDSNNRFCHYLTDEKKENIFAENVILSIFEDRNNYLWIGTYGLGLYKFDQHRKYVSTYQVDLSNGHSISNNNISCIYEDKSGNLWIGTNDGLNKFDRQEEKFIRYVSYAQRQDSISNNDIMAIYQDMSGVLWIGTSGGLNRFNRSNNTFKRYTIDDGLPNDMIYGILEDDEGYLWLSTNNGLSKFDTVKEIFRNYDSKDGLQSNEFNGGAYFKSPSGEMLFGGLNGFNIFYPSEIKDNPHIPPIVITDFQLFNKSVDWRTDSHLTQSIAETEEVVLTYNDYVFSFEFAALDFSMPDKNLYAFKMDGFDEKWRYSGTRPYATYTNLDPGRYVFRVKGSNNDNVWNESGTSLSILIKPPPWKTWWAYSLYILFSISIIVSYVCIQKRKLERERLLNERLRKVDKLKDEFLANTSHELRTPLNGIIGLAESLVDGASGEIPIKTTDDLMMIISSGKRLASLVNDILDFSKLRTKSLELIIKPIDIKSLTEVVLKTSQPLLSGKTITFKNEMSEDLPLVLGDEDRIQQILFNLIGNAIKFTNAGEIKVSAKHRNSKVYVSVSDTGIGIPTDKFNSIFKRFEQIDSSEVREYGGTGLGLAITKQLIELHGGAIDVSSKENQGSRFTFTLPVSKEQKLQASIVSGITKVRFDLEKPLHITIPDSSELGKQVRILVVDDEPINQRVLENQLSLQNFTVTQAYNGAECLKKLEKQNYDMVLLDIMMPRMSGYEVCQQIRQKYLPSELPVIMITAKDQITDLVNGFTSGANDYIAKPFSKDELLARIRTHLNLRQINTASSRFIPHEFLHTLGRNTILDVTFGDHIQSEMTILFSDIRDYTSLSETMTPQENFDFLNAYLGRIGPIIREKTGFVNQYYGDGLMALFPRNPHHAVDAAIEMQKKIIQYNEYRISKNRRIIKVGIGLHSGQMILGMLGDEVRMDGTVVSDAVNTASRLEGLTKRYGSSIIISEHTLRTMENFADYNYRYLGKVQVKGKLDVVSIYEIFDGEHDHIITLKQQTIKDFERGQQYYFNREFLAAIETFHKVFSLNPQDKTAQLFIERSKQLAEQKLPDTWEGIELMEIK